MKYGLIELSNKQPVPSAAPSRLLLLSFGTTQSKKGPFKIDAEAAAAILESFRANGVDLPIDRHHQTLGGDYAAPDGSAPAMGWIKDLQIVAGEGIYAEVEWTAQGRRHIEAGEYRYLSPVLVHRDSDRAVRQLHSVALTNKPAILGARPIAHSAEIVLDENEPLDKETLMNELEKFLAQLREKLGIAADADQAAVMTALDDRVASARAGGELRRMVCKAVGVEENATLSALSEKLTEKLSAHGEAEPDPAKFVPLSVYQQDTKALRSRVEALTTNQRKLEVERFLTTGYSEGRINAAQEPKWRERYLADPAAAQSALEMIPEGTFPKAGQQAVHSDGAPPSSTSPVAGNRASVIARARKDFAADRADILKICSGEEAFVIGELAAAGLVTTLSDDEKKLLV